MKRRDFLGGMLATAASLRLGNVLAQDKRKRVGIIGGGIIGASTALQLSSAGADVILFEKEEPAAGATGASVAWINPVSDDEHYMKLRVESMKAWHEDDALYGMNAMWGGAINWVNGPDKLEKLKTKADLIRQTWEPPRLLTGSEITEVCPGVFPGEKVSYAFKTHRDGHVDPVFATNRYLHIAQRFGAKIIYPCEVTGIKLSQGHLKSVATTQGDFDLDYLVSATGTSTPQIMALMERQFDLTHKPGLVVHTTPIPFETNKVFEANGYIEFKQYYDGRVLSRFGSPPDLPQHAGILRTEMAYPSAELKEWHGRHLISETAKLFPSIKNAEPAKILLGFRPYPKDNRPVIGPVPGVDNVFMVVTHSGITLAPILGRYMAHEIMTGTEAPLLAPYRPTRYIKA